MSSLSMKYRKQQEVLVNLVLSISVRFPPKEMLTCGLGQNKRKNISKINYLI